MSEEDRTGLQKGIASILGSLSPPKPPVVDMAQFIALRTIVTAILAAKAWEQERLLTGAGQAWINDVSALCQDSLLKADISVSGRNADDIRREAIEHVNNMLKSVVLPGTRLNPDH
jgi:hypothetical protein